MRVYLEIKAAVIVLLGLMPDLVAHHALLVAQGHIIRLKTAHAYRVQPAFTLRQPVSRLVPLAQLE